MTFQSKRKFMYPRHLDTALTTSKIDFYRSHPKRWERRYPGIPLESLRVIENGCVEGENIFHWIESIVRRWVPITSGSNLQKWRRVKRLAEDSLNIQIQACFGDYPLFEENVVKDQMDILNSTREILNAFMLKGMVIDVHYHIKQVAITNKYPAEIGPYRDAQLFKDLVHFPNFPGSGLTVPFVFFLSVLDKLEALFAYNVYTVLADQSRFRPEQGFKSICDHIYSILEAAHLELGNVAADLFKALESLCVGVALEILPPVVNSTNFLETTLQDLVDSKPHVAGIARIIANHLRDFLREYGRAGIPVVLEMYGQEKLHYYPIVSDEAGLVKMYRFGTASLNIDMTRVFELAGFFIVDYIVGYFNREHTLPPAILTPLLHPRILSIYEEGTPQSMDYCLQIPLSAWRHLRFKPHRAFNYYPEILDLMDDKAVSPHLSNVDQLFAGDALEEVGRRHPGIKETTKLVHAILQRDEIHIEEYFKEVERSGHFPSEWAAIQLMSKEREQKTTPREFSIMTVEVRLMASVCEKNLTEHLLPIFNQQTMTDSGPQLKDRIDNIINLPETDDVVWVKMHLDLEQWNYTFRSQLQSPFTAIIGQIFGVNHFHTITKIFMQSVLYSANKFCPPGTPGVFHQWNTHAGGNQGIFQKLWTLITITIIRLCMSKFKFRYNLVGSGDNQVVVVEFHKGDNLKQEVEQVRKSLDDAFAKVGLTFKNTETWHSADLFAYQRTYYLDGRQVENGIKQATRAYSGGSDVDAGLNATITTSMNGGMTLAQASADPTIGPIFAYLEAFSALTLDPNLHTKHPISHALFTLVPILNTDAGYFPFIQFHSFLFSGHKDPLTDCLAILSRVWDQRPDLRAPICQLITWSFAKPTDDNRLKLVTDPQSLNLHSGPSVEAILRSAVEDYLKHPRTVNNKLIKSIIQKYNKNDQVHLSSQLLEITPINSGLLHSIMEYSHFGQVARTVGKFTKISSIVSKANMNAIDSGEPSFQERTEKIDRSRMIQLAAVTTRRVGNPSSFIDAAIGSRREAYDNFVSTNNLHPDCTFSVRLFLVSASYGFLPKLVLGPYQPSVIEQVRVTMEHPGTQLEHSILCTPALPMADSIQEAATKKGPYCLLIGSWTDDSVKVINLHSLKGCESGQSIQKNLRILAWLKGSGASQRLLDLILNQLKVRVPLIAHVIETLMGGTAGGNFQHRHASPGEIMGSFINSASQLSTWIQLSTNHAATLQRGEEDRYIFYQQIFQTIIAGLRLCKPAKRRFYAIINLEHCSYLVPNQCFDIETDFPVLTLADFPELRLSPGIVNNMVMEASYKLGINKISEAYKSNPIGTLSGLIALQFCVGFKSYQLGHTPERQRTTRGSAPQSTFNVTLLRKVATEQLMRDLFLQICHMQCMIHSRNPYNVLRHLSLISIKPSGLQDVEPYRALLEGLATAGHMATLVRITNTPQKWLEGQMIGSNLRILLSALHQAGKQVLYDRMQVNLVIEAKSRDYNWNPLWRLLSMLNNNFALWHKMHKQSIMTDKLLQVRRFIPRVNVVCGSDHGLLLEKVRSALSAVTDDDSVIPRSQRPPSIHQSFFKPPGPLLEIDQLFKAVILDSLKSSQETEPSPIIPPSLLTPSLHHISRWASSSSGAKLKMLEILSKYQEPNDQVHLVVCLAEGAGSYASVLLHCYPNAFLIYNSLLLAQTLPHSCASFFTPPETLCKCDFSERLDSDILGEPSQGDLTDESTWTCLNNRIDKTNKQVNILTWDMESYGSNYDTAIQYLNSFILSHRPNFLIIKVFINSILFQNSMLLLTIGDTYKRVSLVKPQSSELSSEEIYIVAKDVLLNKSNNNQLDREHIESGILAYYAQHDKLTLWSQQIKLAVWWSQCVSCLKCYPSNGHFHRGQEHPSIVNLRFANSLLMMSCGELDFRTSKIDKATHHMLFATTKGTLSAVTDIKICIDAVVLFIKISRLLWTDIETPGIADSICHATVGDITEVEALASSYGLPASKTRLLRLFGEMVSSDLALDREALLAQLKMLDLNLKKLQSSRPMHTLQSTLPVWIRETTSRMIWNIPEFFSLAAQNDSINMAWNHAITWLTRENHNTLYTVYECDSGVYEWIQLWAVDSIFSKYGTKTVFFCSTWDNILSLPETCTIHYICFLSKSPTIQPPSYIKVRRAITVYGDNTYNCLFILTVRSK